MRSRRGSNSKGLMKSTAGLLAVVLFAAANSAADERVDYATQIKPLLATKCFACHGALKQESGLRLDAASLIRTGGDSGPVIVAERSPESLLIERVTADDERMPPEGEGEPLTAEQITLLRRWIDQGAIAPDEPIPPNPRDHWAYQPPVAPRCSEAEKHRVGTKRCRCVSRCQA